MNAPTGSTPPYQIPSETGELIRADQALKSFRDAGYNLSDAVGELVDNPIDSGATKVWIDWKTNEVQIGNKKKKRTHIEWFAVCDNGKGIAANILPRVLTVGFSTRYGMRNTIGRFGVGFKLASISQCKRIEVYTKPAYLTGLPPDAAQGRENWTFSDENTEGRIFRAYMDLDEIESGKQKGYQCEEVTSVPQDYAHLLSKISSGVLVVWQKCDRLNHDQSYSETVDEKLSELRYFLSRAYRVYIDGGLNLFMGGESGPLEPYDPSFKIDNPVAAKLAEGQDMKGEEVESDSFDVDGHRVEWSVALTPEITRTTMGGGGVGGPGGPNQFKRLHIPDNQGKVSFLRRKREISYTTVPRLLGQIDKVDRYIGITVSFPAELDEYFQVRHIKRGAEPVEKLRDELRRRLEKPVRAARDRIRKLWKKVEQEEIAAKPDDMSGGRGRAEGVADQAEAGLPVGLAGDTVTDQETKEVLKEAAQQAGITDPAKQDEFAEKSRQKPVLALDMSWPGKGMIDIVHLNRTVLVKINRSHPFIKDVYMPLKSASTTPVAEIDETELRSLLMKATEGIDLLFFAYAKAENMSRNPEKEYGVLREDWGKFASAYLQKREDVVIE